jgi:hypothetical protein
MDKNMTVLAGDLGYGMTYYGDSNGNGVIYRFN